MEADDTNNFTWYIDVSLAAHADMKSHTGAIFTMVKVVIISSSTKQKENERSSTESELIGVDNRIYQMLWMKRFLEWQGLPVKLNNIYPDNNSSINLEDNGK